MKICILTQPLQTNYGGLLQAYALQKILRDMGHDVVTDRCGAQPTIPLHMRVIRFAFHFVKRYLLGYMRYNPYRFLFTHLRPKKECGYISLNMDRFIDNHIQTTDFFEGNFTPTPQTVKKYDALVVGSDQVWRGGYGYVQPYFLTFTGDVDIKRVAYAASFGVDNMGEFSPSVLRECREGAALFDAISVREHSAVELCRRYLDVEAVQLLDPTLLLEKEDYLDIVEECDQQPRQRVLMTYILDNTPQKSAIVEHAAQSLNLTPLDVMPQQRLHSKMKDRSKLTYPSVSTWIAGFRDAEFVVTDSFHGVIFSIIFNKPFVAIENRGRGSTRFVSLLQIFGLESRLITSKGELAENLTAGFDFCDINKRWEAWRKKSIEFLESV